MLETSGQQSNLCFSKMGDDIYLIEEQQGCLHALAVSLGRKKGNIFRLKLGTGQWCEAFLQKVKSVFLRNSEPRN